MTALAILAIVLGVLPLLVGAFILFLDDAGAFLWALGVFVVVCGGLGLALWGLSYLLEA